MLIEAINLLMGDKPDPTRVRQGATEAVVEGLFAVGDDEFVLRRVVPSSGLIPRMSMDNWQPLQLSVNSGPP